MTALTTRAYSTMNSGGACGMSTLTQAGSSQSRSILTTVHGLLTVRRGGQFSKRVRRVATLEEGVLSLRACEGCKPERTLCILGSTVVGEVSNFSITLTSDSCFSSTATVKLPIAAKRQHRVRLYAHSPHKFTLWLSALIQAASATIFRFYALSVDPTLHAGIPIVMNHSMASAVVSLATDRSTRTAVAVKTVPFAVAAGSDWKCASVPLSQPANGIPLHVLNAYVTAQSRRELGVCRHVRHPCVIGIHDVFVTPEVMHIVTDLPGHNLQCLMNCHGSLSETFVARIAYDILQALEYLHGENIVHRSIVPKNICIPSSLSIDIEQSTILEIEKQLGGTSSKPVARIADFATAAFAPRRALPGTPFGGAHNKPGVISKCESVCTRTVMRSSAGLCDTCGVATTESSSTDFDTIQLFGFAHVDVDDELHEQQHDDGKHNNERDCYTSQKSQWLRFGAIDRQTLTDCLGGGMFAAPEIRNGRLHGPAADIWSVGILIYYMLTGRMPPELVMSITDVCSIIEFETLFNYKEWKLISTPAKVFIAALLRPNPRSRLTAETALRNEWLTNIALDNIPSC